MSCEEDLFCGVNQAKSGSLDGMTDLEKKHTPVIDAPAKVKKGEPFDVFVDVGRYLKHPNENAHFIEWIELFSGDTFLARLDLIPKMTEPKAKLTVSLEHNHPLMAKTRCNLHGVWKSFPIPVELED